MAKQLEPIERFWRSYEKAMKLRKHAFAFLKDDEIRFATDRTCGCPITFAANPTEPGQAFIPYEKAMQAFGLSEEEADKIIDAADNLEGHDPKVRERLLRVAGL